MFKVRLVVALVAAVIAAIVGVSRRSHSSPNSTTSQGDRLIAASHNDPRLIAATKKARDTWPEFAKAVNSKDRGMVYSVKVPMPIRGDESGESEHLWIDVKMLQNGMITGRIGNDPVNDIGYHMGQEVQVSVDVVEDWVIGNASGIVKGGYSVPVLEQIEKEGGR